MNMDFVKGAVKAGGSTGGTDVTTNEDRGGGDGSGVVIATTINM
jgi:hypothetical protein